MSVYAKNKPILDKTPTVAMILSLSGPYKRYGLEFIKGIQVAITQVNASQDAKYLNKSCEVLVENNLKGQSKYFGRSRYMNSVIIENGNFESGDIVDVKIKSFNKKNLFGLVINNKVKAA